MASSSSSSNPPYNSNAPQSLNLLKLRMIVNATFHQNSAKAATLKSRLYQHGQDSRVKNTIVEGTDAKVVEWGTRVDVMTPLREGDSVIVTREVKERANTGKRAKKAAKRTVTFAGKITKVIAANGDGPVYVVEDKRGDLFRCDESELTLIPAVEM